MRAGIFLAFLSIFPKCANTCRTYAVGYGVGDVEGFALPRGSRPKPRFRLFYAIASIGSDSADCSLRSQTGNITYFAFLQGLGKGYSALYHGDCLPRQVDAIACCPHDQISTPCR